MLNKIMLIDDNLATNFIHKKFIDEVKCAAEIVTFQSGQLALNKLEDVTFSFPELIFIDINMPTMDGWEFLVKYENIDRSEKENTKIILLTTDLSPLDIKKIDEAENINDIMIKPLSTEKINMVLAKFFKKSPTH